MACVLRLDFQNIVNYLYHFLVQTTYLVASTIRHMEHLPSFSVSAIRLCRLPISVHIKLYSQDSTRLVQHWSVSHKTFGFFAKLRGMPCCLTNRTPKFSQNQVIGFGAL